MNKEKRQLVVYNDIKGIEIKFRYFRESFWMTQKEIAQLFGADRSVITKHLRNIFKTAELSEKTVCAKIAHTASDGKVYQTQYYNLDAIIAVGYRVNSKRATKFRIWATDRLRDYVLKGYVINKKRLEKGQVAIKELEEANKLFRRALNSRLLSGQEKGLLKVITDYTNTWILLSKYDKGQLEIEKVTRKAPRVLDYEDAKESIRRLKNRLLRNKQATEIFGREIGNKLQSILGSLQQTYGKKPLYNSVEEQAAHLLYLVIKDHPFVDGNKRIGSLLFLLYLIENNCLISRSGERKIEDNALTALALLVAESDPKQKDTIVKLIVNLIIK